MNEETINNSLASAAGKLHATTAIATEPITQQVTHLTTVAVKLDCLGMIAWKKSMIISITKVRATNAGTTQSTVFQKTTDDQVTCKWHQADKEDAHRNSKRLLVQLHWVKQGGSHIGPNLRCFHRCSLIITWPDSIIWQHTSQYVGVWR